MAKARITEVLERLWRAGTFTSSPLSIDDRDTLGDTPLHVAAQLGDPADVRVLLEAGADPNAIGGRGRTPLFCTENAKIAEMLVGAGANTNHRDDDGMSASDLAKVLNRDAVLSYLSSTKH